MARTASGGSTQDGLRADRDDGREDDWSASLVCEKEHGASQSADVCREQKLDELARAATQEPKRAAVAARVDELKQQLSAVGGEQRHERVGPRLFETIESVAQDVKDSDGNCEAPQPSETIHPIVHLIRTH